MSSRLFQEVREKRGLAYSVFSYHGMYAETGIFSAYAGTTPSRAEEVLEICRREIQDVAGGGLQEGGVLRGQGHKKGGLLVSPQDTSGRVSGRRQAARA